MTQQKAKEAQIQEANARELVQTEQLRAVAEDLLRVVDAALDGDLTKRITIDGNEPSVEFEVLNTQMHDLAKESSKQKVDVLTASEEISGNVSSVSVPVCRAAATRWAWNPVIRYLWMYRAYPRIPLSGRWS